MAQKRLLTNGNAFKRTDGRWCGVVWYMDEQEQRQRKSFSGTSKAEVNKKMTEYVSNFDKEVLDTVVDRKTLEEGLGEWLRVFKFPSVERATYDRCECSAKNQVYPVLGKKVIGNITAAMIKKLLNDLMTQDYAYTTVKGTYNLLNEYFRYLEHEELIEKNPMHNVQMLKKANFLSAQGKENRPTCETVTIFTTEEIERFKAEAFRVFSNGRRMYQQAAAYVLMLNTGLRTGEMLGVRNSDIDLENRVMHINQAVKEVSKRDGAESVPGREVQIGKPKSASSKRDVPLNDAAVEMILDLRKEMYFCEDAPLIPDENGEYTRPLNFRKRYYRILKAAKIERRGLHCLRHTFATNLVNGIKQPDGSIKSLTPRQVADLLGHTTSEITEMYYVKKDTARLSGITEGFEL